MFLVQNIFVSELYLNLLNVKSFFLDQVSIKHYESFPMFNPFACKYPFILLKPEFGKSKRILCTISSSSSSLMWLYFSLYNWYSWTLLCIVLLLMLNNVAISLLLKLYSKNSVSVSSVSVIWVAQTTISNFWFYYQRTYKIIRLCQMVSDILKMVPSSLWKAQLINCINLFAK